MLSGAMTPPSVSPEVMRYTLNGTGHETRAVLDDSTTPIVTASANPSSLWPPNHKFDPVTVRGHVADDSGSVRSVVRYQVYDEYGQVQPSGAATVHADGDYSFVVRLQASRLGQDKDGRQYTIVVWATDPAGHSGSATTFVVVPHDRGHGKRQRSWWREWQSRARARLSSRAEFASRNGTTSGHRFSGNAESIG